MAAFRSIFAEKVEACVECGFVFTNPRLSAQNLAKYYTNNYCLEGLPVPKSIEEFLGPQYKLLWPSKERDLALVLKEKSRGKLLDIGCASGTLLYLAEKKGFEVTGVEVARESAEFARNCLEIDVFCGQVEDAQFPDREFDVVTMFHSLEHLPDPRRGLGEVERVLKEDGVLIVVVPNFGSWSAKKHRACWRWLQPENHYSHFTPETLAEMADREGFLTEISSEEGRYGEEEIRSFYSLEDIRRIHEDLKGSELILTARKRSTNGVAENLKVCQQSAF